MNFRYIGIVITLFLTVSYAPAANRSCKIQITNKDGGAIFLSAEIADTSSLRETGLMYRKKLPMDNAMLFVFETERMQNFWMKNTYIPLSIAFADRNGIINEIYDMSPLDTSLTSSKLPARYALEANRGWFAQNNITRGCKILLNGCFGK